MVDKERTGKNGHLKHLFLWCFLAISLVALGVGLALMIELGSGSQPAGPFDARQTGFLAALRWHVAAGALLIVAAAGGVFLLLARRVASPLEETALAASRMAEGHLATTVPVQPPNEIGRIGENINGLAVNFQEVLILVWNQTENAIARIRRTTRRMTPEEIKGVSPEMLADLQSAQQELEAMRTMVRAFDLYDVAITDSDVLTGKGAPESLN